MIGLERGSGKPYHRQIYDAFRSMILEHRLQPGEQVPSTRALGGELGLSRIPVLNAYSQLLAEGYFESRKGSGTFVASALPDQPLRGAPRRGGARGEGAGKVSRLAQSAPAGSQPWAGGSGAFSVGQIACDHFPFRAWAEVVTRRARQVRARAMNYADAMGLAEFREVIAAYLRASRAAHCDASQVMVVNGSQQALDLSARVLLDPGDTAWVEDPGYPLMRRALMLSGCRLAPVPVDREGLEVARGIELCANARAAYVTPSHQYPLGVTMSAARRLQLLDWAHGAGSWIVEDDYDSEYRYESMPIASLQGLDRGARVIYIGTFSKTLFPALRLGYLVIPPALVDRFAAVRRACDICAPPLFQAALADFIAEGHFARHIRRTRLVYGERRTALVEALRREFGGELEILGAEAGMHLVATLPPSLSDHEISLRAAQSGLWLWPLSAAYAGAARRQGFILGFAGTPAKDMPLQVRRLGACLSSRP